jgi:multidrug efflux pump subunit AcrA (membrane-fusion protein)
LDPKDLQLYKQKKEFRRLEVGDEVKAGQTVAVVDEALAQGELLIKIAALDAALAEQRASKKTKEEAERRVAAQEESMRRVPGSVSKDDYEAARLTAKRYLEDEVAKHSAVFKTEQELVQANTILGMHVVHAPVGGVIRSIDRQGGEGVKNLETVLTIESPRKPRRKSAGTNAGKLQDIRSGRDGTLAWFGTEVKVGEAVPPERRIAVDPELAAKRYRSLQVGDRVEAGQLVARLDDKPSRLEVFLAEAQLKKGEDDLRTATKIAEVADRRVQAMVEAQKTVPLVRDVDRAEFEHSKLTAARYRAEEAACRAKIAVYQAQLEQARTLLAMVEIRSPFAGVVRELLKRPGEPVAAGEPVLRFAVSRASEPGK